MQGDMSYKGFDGETIPVSLSQFELFSRFVFLETGNQILCLISSVLYLCFKTKSCLKGILGVGVQG